MNIDKFEIRAWNTKFSPYDLEDPENGLIAQMSRAFKNRINRVKGMTFYSGLSGLDMYFESAVTSYLSGNNMACVILALSIIEGMCRMIVGAIDPTLINNRTTLPRHIKNIEDLNLIKNDTSEGKLLLRILNDFKDCNVRDSLSHCNLEQFRNSALTAFIMNMKDIIIYHEQHEEKLVNEWAEEIYKLIEDNKINNNDDMLSELIPNLTRGMMWFLCDLSHHLHFNAAVRGVEFIKAPKQQGKVK